MALIVGMLPVSFTSAETMKNTDCYPIPLFSRAFAWSYFYNSSTHKWYNMSNDVIISYDQPALSSFDVFDGDTFMSGKAYWSRGLWISIDDNSGSDLIGKKVSEIDVLLKKDGTTAHEDIITAGEINLTTGLLNHASDNSINANDDLTTSITYHNFTFSSPFTVTDDTAIGIFINQTGSTSSGTGWHDYSDHDNNDDGYKTIEFDWLGGNNPIEGDIGYNYAMIIKTQDLTLVEIPYTNEEQIRNIEQCDSSLSMLTVGLAITPIAFFVIVFILRQQSRVIK